MSSSLNRRVGLGIVLILLEFYTIPLVNVYIDFTVEVLRRSLKAACLMSYLSLELGSARVAGGIRHRSHRRIRSQAMPVVHINTNLSLQVKQKEQLLHSIAEQTAALLKKPLGGVMVYLSDAEFAMNNTSEPAVFIEVRSIAGTNRNNNKKLLFDMLLNTIQEYGSIGSGRFYVNFSETAAEDAWNN